MKLIELKAGSKIFGINPLAIAYLSEHRTGENVAGTIIHFFGSGDKVSLMVDGTVQSVLIKINDQL